MKISIATLGIALVCASAALSDVVHLKDGRTVEGTIIEQTDEKVIVQTKNGTASFARADVTKIETKETPDQEFKRRKTEAGKDAQKLFDLYLWCKQKDQDKNATTILREIIKVDPDHENARKLLGYVKHDGKWVTEKELEKIKVEEDRKEKEKAGLVEYKGQWVTKEEKEKLEHEAAGEVLVDGEWVKKDDVDRKQREAKLRAEAEEHRAKGEYLVGDKWLPQAEAEAYYKDLTHPYMAEGDHVRLFTNNGAGYKGVIDCGDTLVVTADAAYRKATEFFGKEPALKGAKLNVFVVATLDDYKNLGDGWGADKSSSMSMFCSPWNPPGDQKFDMVSVTMYYQTKQNTDLYTTHATVEQFVNRLVGQASAEAPAPWFVDGVSSYIERWQNPKLFDWSRQRLRAVGWVPKLKTLFKTYTPSEQYVLASGIIVAFLKCPECPEPVAKAFADCIKAVNEGGKMQKAFKDLEKALGEKAAEDAFIEFTEK